MYESIARVKGECYFLPSPSFKDFRLLGSFSDSSEPCIHCLRSMSISPGKVRNHFSEFLILMGSSRFLPG